MQVARVKSDYCASKKYITQTHHINKLKIIIMYQFKSTTEDRTLTQPVIMNMQW